VSSDDGALGTFEPGNGHPRCDVRDDDHTIYTRGEHEVAGWRELDRIDLVAVRVELTPQTARRRVPHLLRGITARRRDENTIARKRDGIDRRSAGGSRRTSSAARSSTIATAATRSGGDHAHGRTLTGKSWMIMLAERAKNGADEG
jgi:hypothetical protein